MIKQSMRHIQTEFQNIRQLSGHMGRRKYPRLRNQAVTFLHGICGSHLGFIITIRIGLCQESELDSITQNTTCVTDTGLYPKQVIHIRHLSAIQ